MECKNCEKLREALDLLCNDWCEERHNCVDKDDCFVGKALKATNPTPQPSKPPDGTIGVRDPDHPCELYDDRTPTSYEFRDCGGDGHYLCAECLHFEPEPQPSKESGE